MALCLCGCGDETPGDAACARSRCYVRYRRNGYKTVPLEAKPTKAAPSGALIPCPKCGRKMRSSSTVCSQCKSREPITTFDLKALAAVYQPSDRFPLEVTSADRVLGDPFSVEDHEDRRRLERGLLRVSCPQCGGKAWQEPPCTVNGVATTVVRCKACDVRKCVECGRPAVFRRDRCAPCRAKLLRGDTMATKGDTLKCPYCREKFTARRSTQVTCGAEECKRLHVNHLTKHPANGAAKPAAAPPPVDAKPPAPPVEAPPLAVAEEVVAKSYGLTPPELDEAMDAQTGDPILRALLAVEALPREKWLGLWDLLEARAEVAEQQRKVDDLLSRLVSA